VTFGRWFSSGALCASLVLGGGSAWANGRYPNADMLVVDPSNPEHLVLRATFGTLVSSDAGRRWGWICEEAVGYVGGDPALTVLSDGRLLHAFLGNIVLSGDGACSYGTVPFSADGRSALDVTLDTLDSSHAWVLTTGLLGRRQAGVLDVSATAATPLVASEDFVPSTIEVSRSRPERLYVVGFNAQFQSTLLVSDDRGQSWQPRPISPYSALPMYISAVAPNDPDTLYVRVDDGSSDHLLVSHDAGQTFSEALTIASDMLGFALSPDGSRVAAGGPDVGLYVASTTDLAFSRTPAPIVSLRCLTWAERGLYACAQESLDNWTLALSTDQGQSFEPLWHVQDLVPLECAASTSAGASCPRAWLKIASRIGAELVPGESEPEPAAPKAEDSGCALGVRPAQTAALARALLPALLGLSLWRRGRRQNG
jgi:hypothetical protein